ncbi:MAG: DNA alkylation repair protein [Acidimicrobiia bacterium]|nr:DNA alkylation repair protein [Acidimicrobiia bacterium]
MAEPLKNSFGPDVPAAIAESIDRVFRDFDRPSFIAQCLDGFDELELTPRARHISGALADHLPADRDRAIRILIESLGPEIQAAELTGMDAFRYLPHVFFVADHGVDHFETAMLAQYELTKRFTAEFSIRAYLRDYQQATLARLRAWADDPNVHVRRLVSEGTRPRLPWAPRLTDFQIDPRPVIELLELLKDDPEEYVRRSVANNLNDIAKDHPDLVVGIAQRWSQGADRNRMRLLRHGLRTLVKQAHPGALEVLGFGPESPVQVSEVRVTPDRVGIGDRVGIEIELVNPEEGAHGALVDLVVHFVKANGSTSAKVFKGAERILEAYERTTVNKTISLKQHSTRTHYPGRHRVEVQLNGAVVPGGEFELCE